MTGEMCREEVTAESYPLHFAIAKALGGTVEPFDQYQGPYVSISGARLWLCDEDGSGYAYVYNDANERKSGHFPAHIKDMSDTLAVEAAQSVVNVDPSLRKFVVTVRRIVREDIQVEVWAKLASEAREEAAMEAQNRHDGWECYHCEYSTDDASEVKEVA